MAQRVSGPQVLFNSRCASCHDPAIDPRALLAVMELAAFVDIALRMVNKQKGAITSKRLSPERKTPRHLSRSIS